jgi:hypothetical protein
MWVQNPSCLNTAGETAIIRTMKFYDFSLAVSKKDKEKLMVINY